MKQIETHRCYNGSLSVYEHDSKVLNCTMRFSVYLPDSASVKPVPVVTFLSGLTCTHENFTTKACAYKKASELGLAIIAPDTSPRGDNVPDDADSYDFGKGVGFYINATQDPWSQHYRMEDYIASELYTLIPETVAVDRTRQSIMGHSMGGHGALTLFLKYPEKYKSVSAFSPIVAPAQIPWGQKAFSRYLGNDESIWKNHDATELVTKSLRKESVILIDQGLSDQFLENQLKPELFKQACQDSGQALNLRLQQGHDHSYYFIQSFVDDHLQHHADALKA